jgi:predicted  nucleic acid-binding Zn-ribbon protein
MTTDSDHPISSPPSETRDDPLKGIADEIERGQEESTLYREEIGPLVDECKSLDIKLKAIDNERKRLHGAMLKKQNQTSESYSADWKRLGDLNDEYSKKYSEFDNLGDKLDPKIKHLTELFAHIVDAVEDLVKKKFYQ